MKRLNYYATAPAGIKAIGTLDAYVRGSGLDPQLLELVKLRASYINGCSYCVDVHSRDALALGETEQRLFAVPVWHETPYFTPRERAALSWTEAVTEIARRGVPDAVYDDAREYFTEKQLLDLTIAVIAINAWNRLAVTFRTAAQTLVAARQAEAAVQPSAV